MSKFKAYLWEKITAIAAVIVTALIAGMDLESWLGERRNFYNAAFGAALVLAALIAALWLLVWLTSRWVNRSAAELRESEQRYRDLIVALPVAVYTCDIEGRVTLYNEQAVALWGKRPGLGRDCWCGALRLYDTDGTPLPTDACPAHQILRKGKKEASREIIIERPDGSRAHTIPHPEPIRDAAGQIIGAVNVMVDITAMRQSEAALSQAEQRLQYHTQNSPLAVIEWDASFRVTRWTGMAEKLFGWPAGEVLGKRIYDWSFVYEADRSRANEVIDRLLSGQELRNNLEIRHCRRDGGILHCEWYNSALRDEQGRVISILSFVLDVTERKQVEARLCRFSDSGMVGVIYWNLEGVILDANDKFLQMVGYTREELQAGRVDWERMTPPEYRQLDVHAIGELMATGVDTPYEKEFFRKNGSRIPVVVGAAMLDDARHEGVAFVLDITNRMQNEEALREANERLASANEKLAEADRRKDEFLAMLAHELRNPLAPVRNAVQIISLAGPREPMLQRQRDIIDRQVTHMARLLDDLLDVSRITRGKITLKKGIVRLADVLARAVETAAPLIESHHHELMVRMHNEDEQIYGDFDRLIQIVGNLLTNAAKYTEEGGQIWLESTRESEKIVISVRDTGVGIAPELLPRIFDVFTQSERSLDRAQGGLGLGLALVRSLVQMHGGSVEVRSAGAGQGSEFIIRLPALPASEVFEHLPESTEMTHNVSARRILVVDDVADTANSLSELLGLMGHQVLAAYDGTSALKLAHQFRPDVILLDIGLPGMNGFEVARQIRRDPALEGAILVALTGYGRDEDRRRAEEAGFDRHFTKPIEPGAMKDLLERME